ncbi:hypothetical protein ABZP36_013486 [Zizania latifolia]
MASTGGGAPATSTEAITSFNNTLLQLQGDAAPASHRLLLDDQAAATRRLVPGPYGDGEGAAAAHGVSPYAADSLQYCSSAGHVLGSSGLFGQAIETPPQFLLQALQPRFIKSNTERLPQDACSPAPRSAPGSPLAAKKPRIEAPSPLPTFKLRKEKLGDRIAALQQLVSPYGKTDTASVLHEAIQYIKFLHDQVASLSSPYLRCGRPMQLRHQHEDDMMPGETKQLDLRSRGLCLVPVATTHTVASETTPEFWNPNFGGTFL